jgi:hypothetical protein
MSRITFVAMLSIILSFIVAPHTLFMTTSAQSTTSTENATSSAAVQQSLAILEPGGIDLETLRNNIMSTLREPSTALDIKMAQLSSSNKTEDIATLAYIWGFPLVTMERQFNFMTSPNVPPGPGRGPANTISCARELVNASFTDVVTPNADTLYCQTQLDLKNEPVILVVPPISSDRYSSFQFLDAYTNDYAYLGTRATESTGGTYLIAGPDWDGQVPEGMTQIWSPTNLAWLINRILVKEPADVPNVHAIQDQITVKPLSEFQGNTTTPLSSTTTTTTTAAAATTAANASKQVPIGPQPKLIPTTGIEIYDEISTAMSGNPLNPPDPVLVT